MKKLIGRSEKFSRVPEGKTNFKRTKERTRKVNNYELNKYKKH